MTGKPCICGPARRAVGAAGLILDVLTVNRRAQALYQRLGMTEVARHGDGKIKLTVRSAQPRR